MHIHLAASLVSVRDMFMIEGYVCRPRLTWCDVFRGYGDLSVHR